MQRNLIFCPSPFCFQSRNCVGKQMNPPIRFVWAYCTFWSKWNHIAVWVALLVRRALTRSKYRHTFPSSRYRFVVIVKMILSMTIAMGFNLLRSGVSLGISYCSSQWSVCAEWEQVCSFRSKCKRTSAQTIARASVQHGTSTREWHQINHQIIKYFEISHIMCTLIIWKWLFDSIDYQIVWNNIK